MTMRRWTPAAASTTFGSGTLGRRDPALCTLLGPEGSAPVRDGPGSSLGPQPAVSTASRGADRTLRTTQWTRASSNLTHVRFNKRASTLHGCEAAGHVRAVLARGCCGRDSINSCSGQVSKSRRWMPWHLEPKKDVAICDKPGGADKRASIPGCPNGETPSGVAIRPDDSRLNT